MIINWFSKTQRSNNFPEIKEKEYTSIFGIIEIVEFNRTPKEINGVLFDSAGREFEFKVQPNGNLIQLTGLKEDVESAWNICVDYLQKHYGKNEFNELKSGINSRFQQINNAIENLSEQIEEIEIPEIIQPAQPLPVVQEPVYSTEQQDDYKESFDDEEEYKEQTFEDFSDEDLASHALKVLNGEVSLSG